MKFVQIIQFDPLCEGVSFEFFAQKETFHLYFVLPICHLCVIFLFVFDIYMTIQISRLDMCDLFILSPFFISKNTDSVSSVTSEKSIASVSSHGSVADLDNSTEEEKPQRSTRTKTRKGKKESVSKTRTKTRKKRQSSHLSSTDYSDDEVMLIIDGKDTKPESNQRLSASNTDDDCAFVSEVQTTRTRTKQNSNSNKSSVKVNLKSDNEDSGILSSKSLSETNLPRTRSKMGHSMLIGDSEDTKRESNKRLSASYTDDDDCAFTSEVRMRTRTRTKQKNNSSVSGVNDNQGDGEKQEFVKPEPPPPRTR